MGVKELWTILAPICEKKSLWELENKSIAIDLSAWICDSQSVATHQVNMYLRNLFFRTSYLLLLDVKPIFVLEGDAPDLKIATIRKRMGKTVEKECTEEQAEKSKKHIRSRLKGLQNRCVELLSYMGVKCVRGRGEAEAFCAHLNTKGVVSGVVTQDSDVFLYGAKEVYRNFQMGPNYSCDCYKMEDIEHKLRLSRTKLIGFSILSGSDYNNGVEKVGKQSALKFLSSIRDDQVSRVEEFILFRYGNKPETLNKVRLLIFLYEIDHSVPQLIAETSDLKLELAIRDKAIQDPEFPYLDVIAEFTTPPEASEFVWEWSRPDLLKFIDFAAKKLTWDAEYSMSKFIPLLGRWHLRHPRVKSLVSIENILSWRQKETENASFKIKWTIEGEKSVSVTTWETESLVMQAYPELGQSYKDSKQKKPAKKAPKRDNKTTKPKKIKLAKNVSEEKENVLDKYLVPIQTQLTEDAECSFNIDTGDFNESENYLDISNIVAGIVSNPVSNPVLLPKRLLS